MVLKSCERICPCWRSNPGIGSSTVWSNDVTPRTCKFFIRKSWVAIINAKFQSRQRRYHHNLTFDFGGYDYWRLWVLAGTTLAVLKFGVCGCRPKWKSSLYFALKITNSLQKKKIYLRGSSSFKRNPRDVSVLFTRESSDKVLIAGLVIITS